MDQSLQGNDLVRALKARAGELQAQAAASGSKMKRAVALEAAAHERGFRDFNAASAAGKAAPPELAVSTSPLDWRDITKPPPRLPMRLLRGPSKLYDSITELMRWAEQLDMIATNVQKDARRKMLNLIGGRVPYVFVQDRGRWVDDVYRLCDRGYDPWPGIAFTRDELEAAGVVEWEEEFGSHGGGDMLSVANDDLLGTSDEASLKRLARLLASIALVADEAFGRQDGEVLPKGQGFTIDLTDPAQLNEKAVARLLGSRDDSQHRQLRVSRDGLVYLSDVVGNNDIDGLAFRLETWVRGNSYVGLAASKDEDWIATVLELLRENWPYPKASLVDW